MPDGEARETEKGELPGSGSGPGAYAYVLSTGADVREQNLVIRIALADLTSARDGDLDRLRQRAQINRY